MKDNIFNNSFENEPELKELEELKKQKEIEKNKKDVEEDNEILNYEDDIVDNSEVEDEAIEFEDENNLEDTENKETIKKENSKTKSISSFINKLFTKKEKKSKKEKDSVEEDKTIENENKNNKSMNGLLSKIKSLLNKNKKTENNDKTEKNNEKVIDDNTQIEEINDNEENNNNEEIEFEDSDGEILSNNKENKKITKKQKLILLISSVVVGGMFYTFILPHNNSKQNLHQHSVKIIKQHKNNKNKKINKQNNNKIKLQNLSNIKKLKSDQVDTSLNLKKNMSYTEANNNQNINDRITRIEKIVKRLSNSSFYTKKNKNTKYNLYKKLVLSLAVKKVLLENGDVLTLKQKGNKVYTVISDEISSPLVNNVLPLVIEDGAIIKIINTNVDYVIFKNNLDEKKWDIIKIDPTTGLKKMISTDDHNLVLKLYKDNKNKGNGDIVVTDYKQSVLLIGKNSQVIEVYKYKSSGKNINLSKIGDILNKEIVLGFIDDNYISYSVRNGNFFKDGELEDLDTGSRYQLEWVQLKNHNTKMIEEYIVIIKNGSVKTKINLNNINSIYFQKGNILVGNKKFTYVKKGDYLYILKPDDELQKVGEGDIISKVKKGKITKKELYMYSNNSRKLNLSKYFNNTLKGKGIYSVTKNGLIVLKSPNYSEIQNKEILPLSEVSFYSNSVLKLNGKKIDTIKEIIINNKIGLYLTTNNHSISLYTKNKYELLDKKTNKITKNGNLKFKLNSNDDTITAFIPSNIKIDKKNKTINGIKYSNYDKNGNMYYLYNENGDLIKKIKEVKNIIQFKEKINSIKILKNGNLFDFFYQIDTKTGTISSNKIGKLIKKFNSANTPFDDFNNNKVKKLVGIQTLNNIINDDISIATMYKNNYLINKFNFMSGGNKINIFGTNNVKIDNLVLKVKSGVYNSKRKLFEIILGKDNKIRKSFLKRINQTSNSLIFYIDNINFQYKNYYDKKNDVFVFKYGKNDILKFKNKFYTINSIDYNFKKANIIISILTENKNVKYLKLNINNIDKITSSVVDEMKTDYASQITVVNKTHKTRQRISELELKKIQDKIKEEKKQIKQLYGSDLHLKEVKVMDNKEIKKMNNKKDVAFTFDVGTKLTIKVNPMIKIPKNVKGKMVIGKLQETRLTDLNGNVINMINPIVVLKAEGDFNTNQVFLNPTLIQYKDRNTGEKVSIKIPNNVTTMEFTLVRKGVKYKTDAIPAYKRRAKLENLNKMVLLQTISGIIKGYTQNTDSMSSMMSAMSGQNKVTNTDRAKKGLLKGTGDGLQQIVDIYKSEAEAEQDILITPEKIVFKVIFFKDVKVYN